MNHLAHASIVIYHYNDEILLIDLISRTRKVLMEIPMPATQVTSLAFGGPKLDILYVVTANKDGLQPEGSGYLYKITDLSAKGYTGVEFNLC